MTRRETFTTFEPNTPIAEMRSRLGDSGWQEVFPVLGENQTLVGLVSMDALKFSMSENNEQSWACAADLMQAPLSTHPEGNLRSAAELLLANGLRELPVLNSEGSIVGFLGEHDIARIYLENDAQARDSTTTPLSSRQRTHD